MIIKVSQAYNIGEKVCEKAASIDLPDPQQVIEGSDGFIVLDVRTITQITQALLDGIKSSSELNFPRGVDTKEEVTPPTAGKKWAGQPNPSEKPATTFVPRMVGNLPTTPRFKAMIAKAAEIAGRIGHNYLGVEHLQAAISYEGSKIGTPDLSPSDIPGDPKTAKQRIETPLEVGDMLTQLAGIDNHKRRIIINGKIMSQGSYAQTNLDLGGVDITFVPLRRVD